jgi:hypothetical protein
MMLRLACLLPLLAPAAADAGACAQPQPRFDVMTTADTALSSGGGVIAEIDDLAKMPAWRFEGTKTDVSPRPIAPGLVTIDVPKGNGWLTLDGADGKAMVRVKHADKEAAALAAPDVASVVYASSTGRRGTSVSVIVNLRVVPADAVALVVYDDKHVARSWGRVNGVDDKGIGVYFSGSCVALPVGTLATNAGDKVELAWLDKSGRLSKTTPVITVKQ